LKKINRIFFVRTKKRILAAREKVAVSEEKNATKICFLCSTCAKLLENAVDKQHKK
jgi:hypothetical protein